MSTSRTALWARGALVAGLLGATALVAPTATASVETPDPSATDGYVSPTPPPTIDLTVLQPVCDGDVPYLVYDVAVTGTPNETVTITWLNPTGDDVVQAGLPLSGRVLWPGATVNAAGEPTGWPGWVFEDGEWVEGGDFGWVRPSVEVLFQVNPEMTVSVDYPPSSPNCSTNPPGTPTTPGGDVSKVSNVADTSGSEGGLAATGATVGTIVGVGAALLLVGGGLVLVARRGRKSNA
ncbi:peptidase [Oerskovia sp. Sa1BUA8]|uniref:Peptidase n=1 Tax=Oerskovia douganii TaxID=2762210 RepID=A0A9D5U6J2_9CELL|nr:peptidase [Oerskovia douganii]MBE7699148.1 peptidase [Oerskovia douganii]